MRWVLIGVLVAMAVVAGGNTGKVRDTAERPCEDRSRLVRLVNAASQTVGFHDGSVNGSSCERPRRTGSQGRV